MKLSVIVPVYNVEKFLPRCLDSLLRQGMKPGEWEVICVNDGSSDNCAAILADYEAKYFTIFKVVTQEHLGVGAARNTGLKVAQGEWIGFVDADDYVVDNGFRCLYEHFLKGQFDILAYDYKEVNKGEIVQEKCEDLHGEVIYDGDGIEGYNRHGQPTLWTKFYRRAYLMENDLWFENVLGEDKIFNLQVFRHNPHLLMTDLSIYRYGKDNQESVMRTKERKNICQLLEDQLYGMNLMSKYLEEDKPLLADGVKMCIYGRLDLVYKESFYVCFSKREWQHYMGKIREMRVNRFLCESEQGIVGKFFARLKVISSHSYLMYQIVRFMHENVFEKYIVPKL